MPRSANRLDEDDSPLAGLMRDGLAAAGAAISRNPLAVGGATAFLVTLFYVSANAIWNQPQPHASAFFITREAVQVLPAAEVDEIEDSADIDSVLRAASVPPRAADPMVEKVQGLLAERQLYSGSIDGLTGPQTRKAIEDYQRLAGLAVSGIIDDQLIAELSARGQAAAPVPAPVGRPQPAAPAESSYLASEVVRIQAGLKAFGHDTIDIDGVMGTKTRSAIREFQSLFGLPVTGEPDRQLIAKMQEIGLTN